MRRAVRSHEPATRSISVARQSAGDPVASCAGLVDLRMRSLVGEAQWSELPAAVRGRFSRRLQPGSAVVYRGRVTATVLSRAGRVLATIARAIGAPLPLDDGATGDCEVTVAEDADAAGQTWTRAYTRPGGARQVIRSMKCFTGATGLEERVGSGIGMALRVSVEGGALHFRSDHFFLRIGSWRCRLPELLEPGLMEIVHQDLGGGAEAGAECGQFAFRLTLTHPWAGRLLYQTAVFSDP